MKKCGNHEIFVTKIFNHGILSNFRKILNHENLELYGNPPLVTLYIHVVDSNQRGGRLIIG